MFERSRSIISTENRGGNANTSLDISSIFNLTRISVKAGFSHIYFDEKTLMFEEQFDIGDELDSSKIIGKSLQNLPTSLRNSKERNILGYDLLFRRSFAENRQEVSSGELSVNYGAKQDMSHSIPNQKSLESSALGGKVKSLHSTEIENKNHGPNML